MIKFLYNGKEFYADNLPKKLKRLKITENDITILDDNHEFVKKDKHLETEFENITFAYIFDKTNCNIILIPVNDISVKPNIYELLENDIWNEETKTGIRNITIDYINKNMILLNGVPKYPISYNLDGNVILEKEYNWK